jgi:hypothetical protein
MEIESNLLLNELVAVGGGKGDKMQIEIRQG